MTAAMRTAIVLALAACTQSSAAPAPPARQLPKKCVAESPSDVPCASFAGTYRVRVSPRADNKKCIVGKPIDATIKVGKALDKGLAELDAKALLAKLGFRPRKDDTPEAGAAVRDGVCCVDVRLTETTGKPDDETERRLILHIARGETKAVGLAEERIMPDHGKDCQNDLDVEVTIVK